MSYQELQQLPPYELAIWNGNGVQEPAEGNFLWSRKDGAAPPKVGAHIRITINNCGPAIVTGYFTEDKWLGVRCTLLDPPEWHRRQNKGDNTCGHVFGPEFEAAA